MNNNTLRFGVIRALAFGGLLVAGAWAGEAAADTPAPQARVDAELQASPVCELDTVDLATRNDLMTKVAAAASIAPRGFGLVVPALIVATAQ